VNDYKYALHRYRMAMGPGFNKSLSPVPRPFKKDHVVQPVGPKGHGIAYLPWTLHSNGHNRSPSSRRIVMVEYVQAGFKEALARSLKKFEHPSREVLGRQSSTFISLMYGPRLSQQGRTIRCECCKHGYAC
jgi:hypothetical protein